MCQKIINVLAVASFAVSGAVVVSGLYVYVNRDSIIDGVKSQVMGGLAGGLGAGGALGGASGTSVVPSVGSPETDTGSGIPSL